MAHLLITLLALLPWLSHLGLYSVHPLEGQRLLHGQHKLGSTPGRVSALQLQPGSLWTNDAGLPETLPPGHLLLPVLPQPGALDPAGGERWAGGGGAGGRLTSIRAHLTSIRVPKRLSSKMPVDSYGQEQSQRLLLERRTEKFPLTLENGLRGERSRENRRMEALGPLSCL